MKKEERVDHRKEYDKSELTEDHAGTDPIALFAQWLKEAQDAQVPEPHAMNLATAGPFTISNRIVLLRAFNADGFIFHTNYNSRKAMDLERDPRAALAFFWPQQERQIRIEGKAERSSVEASDAYFASRPLESKLSAWSSDQSRPVETRAALDERFDRWKERFKDLDDVPRPLHWGGILIRPVRIEFWQGRTNRLHDRLAFEHIGAEGWQRMRLQP